MRWSERRTVVRLQPNYEFRGTATHRLEARGRVRVGAIEATCLFRPRLRRDPIQCQPAKPVAGGVPHGRLRLDQAGRRTSAGEPVDHLRGGPGWSAVAAGTDFGSVLNM